MGEIVKLFGGHEYVPAFPHEDHAVSWNGETWRPLKPCDGHVRDNQGLCHMCGETLEIETWEAYAGEDAPPPSPVVIHYTGW